MSTETIAVLVSLGVLILQIIQIIRYVRLEENIKRITAELDQALNRFHRALELTSNIYTTLFRYYRLYLPLLNQINHEGPRGFWKEQAKYEHVSKEAETLALLNSYSVELRALSNITDDVEFTDLVEQLIPWIDDPGQKSQIQFSEFHTLIRKIQERVYRLIDARLAPNKQRHEVG